MITIGPVVARAIGKIVGLSSCCDKSEDAMQLAGGQGFLVEGTCLRYKVGLLARSAVGVLAC